MNGRKCVIWTGSVWPHPSRRIYQVALQGILGPSYAENSQASITLCRPGALLSTLHLLIQFNPHDNPVLLGFLHYR
jgi:hypothetical protein